MPTEETTSARGFRKIAHSPRSTESQLRSALAAAAERVSEAVLHTRASRIELERALVEGGRDRADAREAAQRRVEARLSQLRGEDGGEAGT